MRPLDRRDDPDQWRALVDGDDSVVTQADDGTDRFGVDKGVCPTSSSSAPRVMERMLELLDVDAGMDVLEIGAGTGYNAALLDDRVAPGRVTTIEVDPAIADHGRRALARAGRAVTVVTGDGALGHPDNAPYDRVIATASAVTVPYAWVAQSRPGGVIVVPVAGSFDRQAFARLVIGNDGTAHGHFHGGASFMRLREQRDDPAIWWQDTSDLQVSSTAIFPREPFEQYEAGFVLGLLCPRWVHCRRVQDDGVETFRLSHAPSGSWASIALDCSGFDHEIIQHGSRQLWDELETAYRWWLDAGRPGHTRIGISVTPKGQSFWLDTPNQPAPDTRG